MFTDNRGKTHKFKQTFYVVSEFTQECYLGANLLFNKHRIKNMNHKGIKLRVPNSSPVLIPFIWKKTNSSIHLLCAEHIEIAPRQIVQVKAMGNKFIPTDTNLIIEDI